MSRVPNADDFLLRLRKIHDNYDQLFGPRIAEVRKKYVGSPLGKSPPFVGESLEAHSRVYIVNALLAALNWRLDASPEDGIANLVPEAPIESVERRTIRFLDYLGLERDTNGPLLIVETKRASSPLPRLVKPSDSLLSLSIPEVICRGLAGEPLMGEWSAWLAALRDYVRSVYAKVKRSPGRVLLTNGDWLILFLDPSDTFLDHGTCDPNRTLVFFDRSDIERRHTELWRHLEHQLVLGETPGLTPGELPFHVAGGAVDSLMHGLHLRYIEQPGIYKTSPVVKIAPAIFLRSQFGAWLRVEAPPMEYELPHQVDQLSAHLAQVREAATNLLRQANDALGTALRPSPLSKHYEDEDSFAAIRGVTECGGDEFLVVTGDKSHYIMPEPSVPRCPHHDWARSHAAGVGANPGPVMVRSILPRSFFVSKEDHHCAHRDVAASKSSQITAENRIRCGARSGRDGQAFCEIWRFDTHLCCRTCIYEDVCTKAEVFHLPCRRPDEGAQ